MSGGGRRQTLIKQVLINVNVALDYHFRNTCQLRALRLPGNAGGVAQVVLSRIKRTNMIDQEITLLGKC